jgi:alpha-D-ribose 1-methylphosphonate 5-triphosphate synthase subunit PhnI
MLLWHFCQLFTEIHVFTCDYGVLFGYFKIQPLQLSDMLYQVLLQVRKYNEVVTYVATDMWLCLPHFQEDELLREC